MGHLKDGSLSTEQLFRYYDLVVKVCNHNTDTARKLERLYWSKEYERRFKRVALGLHDGETVAGGFLALLLRSYIKYGDDSARAMRSVKIMYRKLISKHPVREAYALSPENLSSPHHAWRLSRGKQLLADEKAKWLERHPEAARPSALPEITVTQVLYAFSKLKELRARAGELAPPLREALYAELERLEKENEGLKKYLPAQRPAKPVDEDTPAIEVVFKHPTERSARTNTAEIKDGQPIARIAAGGDAKDFWRGVFFTMEFSKEEN